MDSLTSDWVKKESNKHPGKVYYFNKRTGKSSWEPPKNINKNIANANFKKCKESCTNKLVKLKASSGISKTKNPAQDRLSKLQTKLFLEQKAKIVETTVKHNKNVNLVKEADKPVTKPPTPTKCNKKTDVTSNNNFVANAKSPPRTAIALRKDRVKSKDPECVEPKKKDRPLKRTQECGSSSVFTKIPRLAIDALCRIPKLVADNFSKYSATKTSPKRVKEIADIATAGSELIENSSNNVSDKNASSCKILSIMPIAEVTENAAKEPVNSSKVSNSSKFTPTQIGGAQLLGIKAKSANDRLQNLRKHLETQRKMTEGSESSICPANAINSEISTNDSKENSPMDWEEIDEQINEKITEIRQKPDENEGILGDFYSVVNHNLLKISAEQDNTCFIKENKYYFVVDTNVFLRNLSFVDDLRKLKFCDTESSVIVVPYSVLQELDRIKTRSNQAVSTLAVRAIKYLNEKFESKDQCLRGQNAFQANRHLISIENADDNILNCCLQIKEKTNKLLLLTNDVNLRNKAICNNIPVSTKSDLETAENFSLT